MIKIFIALFIALYAYAGEHFKESRYIYAIDKQNSYEGEISFLKNSIQIDYTKPQKETITYAKDDEDYVKKSYYLILSAVYNDNENVLKEYFEVKKQNQVNVLEPLGFLSDYIHQITFKKSDGKLDFLKIQMQNDDWILIETVH